MTGSKSFFPKREKNQTAPGSATSSLGKTILEMCEFSDRSGPDGKKTPRITAMVGKTER